MKTIDCLRVLKHPEPSGSFILSFWKTPNWRFFGKSKNRTTLLKTKEKFCIFLKRQGRTKRKVQEFQELPITVVQGQAAAHVCGVINLV
jgi:hypothetical protein